MTAAELIAMVERAGVPEGADRELEWRWQERDEALRWFSEERTLALARLCAEQHEALAELEDHADLAWGDADAGMAAFERAREVIGKFTALGEPASGEEDA